MDEPAPDRFRRQPLIVLRGIDVLRGSVVLMLAVALTILNGWVGAVLHHTSGAARLTAPLMLGWPTSVPHDWPAPNRRTESTSVYGHTVVASAMDQTGVRTAWTQDTGYVGLVLRGTYRFHDGANGVVHLDDRGYIEVPAWLSARIGGLTFFPIRPRPVAFAYVTFANCFIVTAAWLSARRWLARFRADHRTRLGRCIACGYAVRELPMCPECGQARPD